MRADDTEDVPQHRDEDQETIDSQNETSTTGGPNRKLERIEARKGRISFLQGERSVNTWQPRLKGARSNLRPPSIGKCTNMNSIPEHIKH
jgi:hypothetical protein